MRSTFEDLSEEEKESDRKEADKFIKLFKSQLQEKDKVIEYTMNLFQEFVEWHEINFNDEISFYEQDTTPYITYNFIITGKRK